MWNVLFAACMIGLTFLRPTFGDDRVPNIVVLLADDLGYGETGCQGNAEIPTPRIDAIARQGVRFTQGYVVAPNCSPSRAGLLTGRIPMRFGYEFNPIGARNEDPGTGIPRQQQTLAEALHDVGYATALIGKWHLGGAADYHPQRHGFDEFYGFLHEGHYFVPPPWHGVTTMLRRKALPGNQQGRWERGNLILSTHMGYDEPDYDANNPIIRAGQPVSEAEYLTDAFTREAVDFINRHQDRPFFLMLAYNAVHSPLQATDAQLHRNRQIDDIHRRIFAGMLTSLDDSVGAVVDTIERAGVRDRTLMFFLSDNGGPTRELTSGNQPLRGEKGQMYEGGLRVPFLIQWPGHVPADIVYDRPVSSLDIFATAAAVAGAQPTAALDGTSLIPFLTGEQAASPHRELFWRQGRRAAFRMDDWKIVSMMSRDLTQQWELYNLRDDPGEQVNLAESDPERLDTVRQRWESINADMQEPLFGQR